MKLLVVIVQLMEQCRAHTLRKWLSNDRHVSFSSLYNGCQNIASEHLNYSITYNSQATAVHKYIIPPQPVLRTKDKLYTVK